jgi:apolipoprotein N-acyltransferase
LLWTLDLSTSFRQAFFKGWLAGVGYFAVGVWWVVEPFMVDAANQGWMAPFALVLMAGGLSLFWGLAAMAYRACRARGVWRVIVFAGCLAGFEWLRGHVMTGFPWDLPGESWRAGSEVSQAAALFGAYGLTWVTVALGAAPALLAYNLPRPKQAMALGLAALTLAGLWGFGAWRLSTAPKPAANAPMVRVVQANIDQKTKWKAENLDQIFHTYLDLTGRPAARTPDVVIWPEGALPAVIDDLMAPNSGFPTWLVATMAENQTLMMGANRAEGSGADARYFNSLVAFRRQGEELRVTGVYDKHRLVPFGEFMPLGGIAGRIGFRSLVHMPDDFSAGPKPNPIHPDGLPAVQPLICYEALFPGLAQRSEPRPAWILNISNDAWFGMTSGPLQHLNIASYRAIEQGLPIVRATPTGVSAVIDAQGRILPGASLPMGGFGIIDAVLPSPRPPTPYSELGDAIFLGMLLMSAAAAAGPVFRRTR